MFDDTEIIVENLSKVYKLYNSPLDRLKESLHPLRRQYHQDFYALNNVNFEIKKGESVGIIGKNGSGKSTLLKILTGVLTPTSGSVTVNGKVSALLELGAGFNPELTGFENVYFNGMLLGYTHDEMDQRLDDILAFADIGEFVHQPVKTYSSGMFVRLAFSVAVNVEPEILIVDEALSVGDIFFQQKCYRRMRDIIGKGVTCLFVSHDTTVIRNVCDNALLLNNGTIEFRGKPEEAVSRYNVSSSNTKHFSGAITSKTNTYCQDFSNSILKSDRARHGAGGIEIIGVRVTDTLGNDTLEVEPFKKLSFMILLKSVEQILRPSVGIHIYDRIGNLVFSSGSRILGQNIPDLEADSEIVLTITVTFNLQPGEYTFSLGVADFYTNGDDGYLHDRCESLGPITVKNKSEKMSFSGIAYLPMTVEVGEKVRPCH